MQQSGALPITRVWEIFKYFRSSPPLHLLVRDFVGYKDPSADEDKPFEMPSEMHSAPVTKTLPSHLTRHLQMKDSDAS